MPIDEPTPSEKSKPIVLPEPLGENLSALLDGLFLFDLPLIDALIKVYPNAKSHDSVLQLYADADFLRTIGHDIINLLASIYETRSARPAQREGDDSGRSTGGEGG